jgi:hypothetical protein
MNNPLLSYIQENGFDALVSNFQVNLKRHSKYPNLIHLKYNQIETPMNDVTIWCRGAIIDEQTMKFVALPYCRFFNAEETKAAVIDWSTAKCFNKVDGSLVYLYYYNNEWHVSTSGIPDASGTLPFGDLTFKDLFWKVWNELGYKLPEETNHTFIFELMTPYNKVVVPMYKNQILMHGVRNIDTLQEFDHEPFAKKYGWQVVDSYNMNNLEDILAASKVINPMEQEGYVICDQNFNRIKIKSEKYIMLHHLKNSFSIKNIVRLVLLNEDNEFLSYFREYHDLIEMIKMQLKDFEFKVMQTYTSLKHFKCQKDFALKAIEYKFSPILFLLRKGVMNNFREYLINMHPDKLVAFLEIKNVIKEPKVMSEM